MPSSANFTTDDGVRLHFLDAGKGRPLVLLPGWTQPADGFAAIMGDLSNDHRCIAIDFRGHGISEQPTHGYRVSRFARDCLNLLEHLQLDDAVLLGHSAGCAVIWSFIDLFGEDRIAGTILCDEPIAFIQRPEWSDEACENYGALANASGALKQAAEIASDDGEQVLRDFIAGEFSSEFPRAEVERVIAGSLRMPRVAAADLMVSVMQADYRDLLPRIRSPTLCIGGTRSHLGPAVMPWIAAQIPRGEIRMIDGQHFVHLENPKDFNQAVRDFVSQL